MKKGDLVSFNGGKVFYLVEKIYQVNFSYYDSYGELDKTKKEYADIVLSLQEDGSYKR